MRRLASFFRLGFGATALVTISTSCDTFEGLPTDAGATDAATTEDSSPGPSDASAPETSVVDASSTSPCRLLDAGLGHFCDDFDSDPARVDFAGWSKAESIGSVGYNNIAASTPWAFASLLKPASSSAKALIVRDEAPGKKFRVRFDIMGDGPPAIGAPLYFARVVVDDTYVLALRAFGEGNAVVVSEAKKTEAGADNGANTSVSGAPRLASGKWITVEISIDEADDKWVVLFDGKPATGKTFVPLSSQPRLRLELGAELVNGAPLIQNTTLHYDNVLIESER